MSLLDTASLIVTPNGYKEGKLYSVIPSDGSGDMSVTRATTATRVNSAGLVELVPYNVIRYSQEFDNASWSYYQATITPNVITAPDGTMTGDRLNQATGTGGNVVYSNETLSTGNITLSAYLKLGTGSFGAVSLYDGSWKNGYFNLTTGAVHYTDPGVTASIQDAGNGWWRCIITINSVSNSVTTNVGHVLNSGEFGYIWGAQLVEGSTAKDYQKTETRLNIPRLDYSNGTCPSLLVEPQRTNVSQYVETGSASFNSATVVSASSLLGMSAFQVTTNIPTFGDAPYIFSNTNFAANTSYTFSFYTDFNQCSGTNVSASFLAFFPSIAYCAIDVDKVTKAITTTNVGGVWTINSYEAKQINGEIYRIYITATPNASGSGARNYLFGNPNLSSIKIAGVQLEAGSYETSYIEKTTSASVTRNADVISKTGISSLIGQTEGTIFCEFFNYNNNNSISNVPFSISNGAYGDAVYFEQYQNTWYAIIFTGFTMQFQYVIGALSEDFHKIAIAYKTNDIALYLDGNLLATDTSATIPLCSRTDIGNVGTSSSPEQVGVKAAALWKTRLTNTQLAQLTSI